ncbi:MAG: insulinase family protein, partial [Melioribacteraceae bacterium]|nr:insulinase family protein [Melioribacteraceae bacterium]
MNKKSFRLKLMFCFIIVFNFFTLSYAQSSISSLPEGVSIYQLDNGLKVMLIEKPSLPMVGINTVVKVGSAYENFVTSGMSHMLEHLLFNGTNTMTQKELYDSTDIIGGYNNANTGEYYTNFMMVTPAENILDGMKLQAAMLFDSVIPEDKFEKEKGIVLEEIAKSMAKSNEQLERNVLSIIYEGHALSLPTLGTYSTIKNMNRDDVYNFYKNYYNPNNMIVSVIGNFSSAQMLENIKDIYGENKPNVVKQLSNSNIGNGFESFANYNLGKVFHRFYNGENTHLQMFFELEQPANLEYFEILQIILDNNNEKIKDELTKKYGDQIQSVEFSIRQYPVLNYLEASLILRDEKNIEAIQKLFAEILSKLKFEIPKETISTEAIKVKTEFLKNTEKPHMFGIYNASLFAEYGVEAILSSYSGNGFMNAAAELKSFEFSNYYITIIQHPQIKNEASGEIVSGKINVSESSGNNSTLISKQNIGSDLLAIHYLVKNKAKFEAQYGKNAAKHWHDAFGKRMEKPEVQKISSKYGFTFTVNDNPYIPMDNIYLSPEFGYIRVEGLANDIEKSIHFLNTQMLSFVPTKAEFEEAKGKSARPSMMGHGNMAKELFDTKLNSLLYEEELYKEGKAELTYEDFLSFGKEYFSPSNMIISVVSPSSKEDIEKYFSTFTKSTKSENGTGFIKGYKNISDAVKIEETGGGEQSYLYYGFPKDVKENDIPALQVLSLLLADEIIFDIREKQGMAYRMSAGIDIIKNKAMFYINMGTRPENVDVLIPQFSNFFTRNFSEKITATGIKKSVNMYLGRMMFRRLSSINQAYYLGESKYF